MGDNAAGSRLIQPLVPELATCSYGLESRISGEDSASLLMRNDSLKGSEARI